MSWVRQQSIDPLLRHTMQLVSQNDHTNCDHVHLRLFWVYFRGDRSLERPLQSYLKTREERLQGVYPGVHDLPTEHVDVDIERRVSFPLVTGLPPALGKQTVQNVQAEHWVMEACGSEIEHLAASRNIPIDNRGPTTPTQDSIRYY